MLLPTTLLFTMLLAAHDDTIYIHPTDYPALSLFINIFITLTLYSTELLENTSALSVKLILPVS